MTVKNWFNLLDFSEYECRKLRAQLDYFIDDVRADPFFSNCYDLGVLAMKMVETDRHTTFPLVIVLLSWPLFYRLQLPQWKGPSQL
jgi:hypothetical protein